MNVDDLERLLDCFPDYRISHDNAPYYSGLLERRLLLDRCGDCGRWRHPPAPMCPDCWSSRIERAPAAGTGSIHVWTAYHTHDPVRGGTDPAGTVMVTVRLDEQEDLVVTSLYTGARRPTIGERVRLVWIDANGHPFPAFEPTEPS